MFKLPFRVSFGPCTEEKMSLLEVLDIHGTEIERGKFNGMSGPQAF